MAYGIYPSSQWYREAMDVFLRDLYDPLQDETWIMLVDGGYDHYDWHTLEDIEKHECAMPGYRRQRINLTARPNFRQRTIKYVANDTKFVLHELPVEGYGTEDERSVSGAVVYVKRTEVPVAYLSFSGHRYIVSESLTIAWGDGVVMTIEF